MSDVEQRARDALNKVAAEHGWGPEFYNKSSARSNNWGLEAMCRQIEAHDSTLGELAATKAELAAKDAELGAFRREVSADLRLAVKKLMDDAEAGNFEWPVNTEALALIEAHILPDPVDPLLIKARRLVADIARHLDQNEYADLVEAGDRDKSNEVQSALRGLTIVASSDALTETQP